MEDIVDVHAVADAYRRRQTEGIELAFRKVKRVAVSESVGGSASVEPYDIRGARKRESGRVNREFRFAYSAYHYIESGVVVGLVSRKRSPRTCVSGYRAERLDLVGRPGIGGERVVLGGYLTRVEHGVLGCACGVKRDYHGAALVVAEQYACGVTRFERRDLSRRYRFVEVVRHYLLRQYVDVKRHALSVSDVIDNVEVHFVQRMRSRVEIEIFERTRVCRFDVPARDPVGHVVAFVVEHGGVVYVGNVDGDIDPLDAGKLCVNVLRLRRIDRKHVIHGLRGVSVGVARVVIDLREISEAAVPIGVIHNGFESERAAMFAVSFEFFEVDSRIDDISYVFFVMPVSLYAFVSALELGKFAVSRNKSRYRSQGAEFYFARVRAHPTGIESAMERLVFFGSHGDNHFAVLLIHEVYELYGTYLVDRDRGAVAYFDRYFHGHLVARARKDGAVGRRRRLEPVSEFRVSGSAVVGNFGRAEIPLYLIEYVTPEEVIADFAVHREGLSVVLHHSRIHERCR